MPSARSKLIFSILSGATVAAHGHIPRFVINGVQWPGFDPTSDPYKSPPPVVAGWTTGATDNGFVDGSTYSSEDIICHRSSKNAKGHAVVAAGDQIFIIWNTWPDSHKGPVLDYLASCGDAGCETVDKKRLKFFKIDEAGLVDGSQAPGKWASDGLIANGNGWMVRIPVGVAQGNYVLRHEMIALHAAGQEGQAQHYPQCINLQITGSGTDRPEGVLGTELYKTSDPGIKVNIYQSLSNYTIPGPPVYSGVGKPIEQAKSVATATATALTRKSTPERRSNSGGGGGSGSGATTSASSTTSATAGSSHATKPDTGFVTIRTRGDCALRTPKAFLL